MFAEESLEKNSMKNAEFFFVYSVKKISMLVKIISAMELGLMNMNNTKNCQAHGMLPYISLGFTWHTIYGMETTVDPSHRPRFSKLGERNPL